MQTREVLLLEIPPALDAALSRHLAEAGWTVRLARDIDEAAALQRGHGCRVGLAVVDSAARVTAADLRRIRADEPMEWIAVLPREATARAADAQALAASFHDFHSLPVDYSRLLVVLGHALGKADLLRNARTSEAANTGRYGMVGRSPKMLDLYRALDKIVRVDAPVLISGESGTGKELVARAIHQHSQRSRGPLVTVNCGALPQNLVQAELFGHEKGSFTGAHQRRVGSIECAEGGTIFLDEVGDLPLESQASLLRFLQERTVVRVGSTRPIRVDARVVAASHVDLGAAVRRSLFREDLYYRLNVLHVHAPSLRERPGDIGLLAQWVFETNSAGREAEVLGFSPQAIDAMEAYAWPGNVRELVNRVQKAIIMCDGPLVGVDDLGLERVPHANAAGSLAAVRTASQRDLIRQTLEQHRFNIAASARALGVSRVTLYRLMHKFEIAKDAALAARFGVPRADRPDSV
ncbi:MAG: sigma-54 dependent transcriptional regulator [Burkholderiales bacterium]|jgi:DNA-binding NtrC family response regulator|nr:sigma-54 dependent transcriptional regulator [Burkholderiales bacterium]